jgi:DNA-binding CsgD family transcriptional regulator
VRGKRLEEVAAERGVQLTTVRSQLQSLFAKTETNRQVELVRLLARLAALGAELPTVRSG